MMEIGKEARINEGIFAREVRLIDKDGEQLGVVQLADAQKRALTSGLDLVEIAPTSKPPVCKIMDYGKFKFEQTKRDKEAKKKQKTFQLKEVKLRLGIETHDFEVKAKNARKFLGEGHKVKVTIMFKGRELAHPEQGVKLCKKFFEGLEDISSMEKNPKGEGRNMIMILSPKTQA